jgi:hypothetical protein
VSILGEDVLLRSIDALKAEVAASRAEMARLADDVRRGERELQLLRELARLRGLTVEGITESTETDQASSSLAAASHRADHDEGSNRRDPLIEAVVEILRGSGAPMHIQDLVGRVREAGVQIPGSGSSANLIGHIRGSAEIVRPVRGMYALREWGLEDRQSARQTRRRRRTTGLRKSRRSVQRASRTTGG